MYNDNNNKTQEYTEVIIINDEDMFYSRQKQDYTYLFQYDGINKKSSYNFSPIRFPKSICRWNKFNDLDDLTNVSIVKTKTWLELEKTYYTTDIGKIEQSVKINDSSSEIHISRRPVYTNVKHRWAKELEKN